MWNIYNNKAKKHYKKNACPIEDEQWKEVKEKYGDLVNPVDCKSIEDCCWLIPSHREGFHYAVFTKNGRKLVSLCRL